MVGSRQDRRTDNAMVRRARGRRMAQRRMDRFVQWPGKMEGGLRVVYEMARERSKRWRVSQVRGMEVCAPGMGDMIVRPVR